MSTNHESVLYFVEKRKINSTGPTKVTRRYIFRTRAAAEAYQKSHNQEQIANAKANGLDKPEFIFGEPRRAEWGPDNV